MPIDLRSSGSIYNRLLHYHLCGLTGGTLLCGSPRRSSHKLQGLKHTFLRTERSTMKLLRGTLMNVMRDVSQWLPPPSIYYTTSHLALLKGPYTRWGYQQTWEAGRNFNAWYFALHVNPYLIAPENADLQAGKSAQFFFGHRWYLKTTGLVSKSWTVSGMLYRELTSYQDQVMHDNEITGSQDQRLDGNNINGF